MEHIQGEPYRPRFIMGLESSCDETSVAIIENGTRVLANLISSQIPLHEKFGGVVPEVACRAHMEVINPLIQEALDTAQLRFSDLNAIAVTCGPGLVGAVLLGVATAKCLAGALNIPLIGVNHLEGHLYSSWIDSAPEQFPMICLLVSGGHTLLIKVDGPGRYQVLGSTRDDAAGEAFDKVAKALGMGYPGGAKIEKAARRGNPKSVHFARPMLKEGYEFSFSGLKTSVLVHLQSPERVSDDDVCAAFQEAVTDTLVTKTMRAVREFNAVGVSLAGGVAANGYLRDRLERACQKQGVFFKKPDIKLCTDNAAMIARAGWELANLGWRSTLNLDAKPNLELTPRV